MSIYRIWANRLEAGTKTWEECPNSRKPGVELVLIEDVKNGVIAPERFEEITGEPYEGGDDE